METGEGGKEERTRMRKKEEERESNFLEYIYALKETIWDVLFLPLESKASFGYWKTLSLFLQFIFDSILFQNGNCIMQVRKLYIIKEQFPHFVTTTFMVHGVLISLL